MAELWGLLPHVSGRKNLPSHRSGKANLKLSIILGTSPTGFANGTQPNGCVRLGEDPAPAAVTFGRVCSGW
ncbi:uncharacterized protein LOC119766057 isoform X2 [Culex quinquefasciatus]|uniref:uncharacterized protein LOC119766057 isoform X2 n=1 Tax=Culex quinquefasciatus TaxID=7176 RepID=UPI0018E32FD6|nr:uncharacterized protein LOC119766057 isoform X2 [Culex quinquefasciatus]